MSQHQFNYRILDEVDHRPWPLPHGPWIMRQTWHDLLFAHWPVDQAALASIIPPPLALDLYEGDAWVGIVPFHMTNVAPRGVPPLPLVSAFPELNVRTYVHVDGRPGVYFFSLDAGNRLAVAVARGLFHLPYYLATMRVEDRGGAMHYTSERVSTDRGAARLAVTYEPSGSTFRPPQTSLEHFLTERYCLYTVDGDGRAARLDIHHPPWSLQPATATFHVNTMADPAGIPLPAKPPLLHFVKRQDMVAWPLIDARSRR
jgi:uncharacterized protein YqjF (DUF2071 family)